MKRREFGLPCLFDGDALARRFFEKDVRVAKSYQIVNLSLRVAF